MAEGRAQWLSKPAFRYTVFAILTAITVWFFYRSLAQGSTADRCANALVEAVVRKDHGYLAKNVRNPSLAERLLAADRAELGFVRPVDPEWSRIGVFVRETATATSATPIFILLSHARSDGEECAFVEDYDHL